MEILRARNRRPQGLIREIAGGRLPPCYSRFDSARCRSEQVSAGQRREAATDGSLGRAIDRLERLQRRRKGEFVPPPVTVDSMIATRAVASVGGVNRAARVASGSPLQTF